MQKSCNYCQSTFTKKQNCSLKEWATRKYCSAICGNKGKETPWLKKYHIKKGQSLSKKTQFKRGETSGSKNHKWKGDSASYTAKHIWIRYHFGKPQFCEQCGTVEKRMYHWANISGEYIRDRSDWLRLCVPCHKSNDIKALGGKIKAKPLKLQPGKVCLECDIKFFKKPRISHKQWQEQVRCGRICANKSSTRKQGDNYVPNNTTTQNPHC